MLRIEIGDRKEAILYGIVLGCVLLLVIGATLLYWSHSGTDPPLSRTQSLSNAPGIEAGLPEDERTSVTTRTSVSSSDIHAQGSQTGASWVFLGTVIVALLLLFCLTFRYYMQRDMKEAEKKWQNACENFLTRMEIERRKSEGQQLSKDSVWSKILKGEV